MQPVTETIRPSAAARECSIGFVLISSDGNPFSPPAISIFATVTVIGRDQSGVVARVTSFVFVQKANIEGLEEKGGKEIVAGGNSPPECCSRPANAT